jgi:hypothetical protein
MYKCPPFNILDGLQGKTKELIIELKQEMNSYLARENQREYSKVPFARPETMY